MRESTYLLIVISTTIIGLGLVVGAPLGHTNMIVIGHGMCIMSLLLSVLLASRVKSYNNVEDSPKKDVYRSDAACCSAVIRKPSDEKQGRPKTG